MASTNTLDPNATPFNTLSIKSKNPNEQSADQSMTSPELLNSVLYEINPDQFYRVGDAVPPIIGKPNSLPSPTFALALIEALNKVPIRLRKAVSDWGYKIVTATTMPEVLPEQPMGLNLQQYTNRLISTSLYARVKQMLQSKNWWQACLSNHPVYPKTITMPEQAWKPQGFVHSDNMMFAVETDVVGHLPVVIVDTFRYVPVTPPTVEVIMLHELGHAVDDYLGNLYCKKDDGQTHFLSASKVFSLAYLADIKALTDERVRRYLAYYLPREDDPHDHEGEARREAFAEIFARLQITDGDPNEHAFYLNRFPNVSHFIEKYILRCWRRDESVQPA